MQIELATQLSLRALWLRKDKEVGQQHIGLGYHKMTIKQLMQLCFAQGLDGKQTDTCVKGVAVNLLSPKMPVTVIDMDSPEDLLRMMKGADFAHMFVEGGTCHFNALYSVAENFPAPRIYFMKSHLFDEIARLGVFLERHGFKLPIVNTTKFSELIEDKEYASRYRRWHERWEAKCKAFRGLVDGRVKNTAVEKGMWLATDGCLICGEETDYMSTGTLIGASGLIIGLRLCKQHEDEAQNHASLIEYIAKKMGVPAPFFSNMKFVTHTDETLAMSCLAVQNGLECEIEKVEEKTITAVRRSGFRIILRQDALADYAYMIQDPNRKAISRIDSANHHVVEYGPDHIHRNLSKSKKNQVESSFTYGFVVADLKAIKALVEEAESRWKPH